MSTASPSKNKESPEQLKQLEGLRSYIQSLGGKLEERWTVQLKTRAAGSSHATATEGQKSKSPNTHVDTYYISPKGAKFRSKLEVARSLGLSEKKEKSSGASASSKEGGTKSAPAAGGSKKGGSGGAAPTSKPSNTAAPAKPQKQITAFFHQQSGAATGKPSTLPSDPKRPQAAPQPAKPVLAPAPPPPSKVDDHLLPDIAPPPPSPLY